MEEIAEDLLILSHPERMKGIRPSGLLAGGVLGGEDFGRLRCRAINIVEEAGTPQLWPDLSPPQNIVAAG